MTIEMSPTEYEILTKDIDEIKQQLNALNTKIDNLSVPVTAVTVQRHDKLIEDHENRLKALESFAPFIKAMMVVAGLLGASVAALIWALIIGQAQVVFP